MLTQDQLLVSLVYELSALTSMVNTDDFQDVPSISTYFNVPLDLTAFLWLVPSIGPVDLGTSCWSFPGRVLLSHRAELLDLPGASVGKPGVPRKANFAKPCLID